MAFQAIVINNDHRMSCDKCGQATHENDPIVDLIQRSTRREYHTIRIHVSCFCEAAGAVTFVDKYSGRRVAYFNDQTVER